MEITAIKLPVLANLFTNRFAGLVFLCFLLFPFIVFPQENNRDCDEVLVSLEVDYIGSIELSSFICDQEIYLSVPEVFNFINIRNISSNDFNLVEGYFIDQDNGFQIDKISNQIIYKGKTIALESNDLIKTKTNLFLKSKYFEELFGLENTFSFRTLSVSMSSELELPKFKEAKREQMRANINKVKQDFKADTTVAREGALFHLGTANWGFNATQRSDGYNYNRFNLGLGGLLAGGEFVAKLNANSQLPFSSRNQFYRWRYVNNENEVFRQISLGKISGNSIASIYDPVVGIQITNTPTYKRKSFGTYVLSDHTEPDWMVELYINNVLVDYMRADAAGFFSFNVPLMYGNTAVSLRFYGPYGEEHISHENFNIPFNFLPKNKFEYIINAGMVEDDKNNTFINAKAHYGLSRNITVGGGVEYFSDLENPIIPFVNASIRLPHNMLFSGEYAQDIGFTGIFSYTAPSNLRLELNYKKYNENQEAVRFNYLEERKAAISMPLKFGKFSGNTQLTFRQSVLHNYSYTHSELLLSGSAYGMNLNLTNYAFSNGISDPIIYSRFATSIRLPKSIVFSPQLQYEYSSNSIMMVRAEFKKRIFKKAHLNISYDRNFKYDQNYLQLGFRYDLGFSRVGITSSITNQHTSVSESANGNLVFEPGADYLKFNNNLNIGRASIKFIPFLDINGNGKKDFNEASIEGVDIRSKAGGRKEQNPDGTMIFSGLEPYITYHFIFNTSNLDRISWIVENKSLNIILNPNELKVMDIPVKVVGEVAGFVLEKENNSEEEGISGIEIEIHDENGTLVKTILSEGDGFFSFLGLKSGIYTARVNPDQLEKLGMAPNKPAVFNIDNTSEGDYVDNLAFVLQKKRIEITDDTENPEINENQMFLDSDEEESGTKLLDRQILWKNSSIVQPDLLSMLTALTDSIVAPDFLNSEKEIKSIVAKDTINQRKSAIELEEHLLEVLESIHKNEQENITQDEKLIFKVQIMASKPKMALTNPLFNGLEGIEVYQHEGLYKYTWGKSSSFLEAEKIKNQLRSRGFSDAFVVPFNNENRLNFWQVEGSVFFKDKKLSGIGGVKIDVHKEDNTFVASALSEADGNFTILGLRPGKYIAKIAGEQLDKMQMSTVSTAIKFSVDKNSGVTKDQLEFILNPEHAKNKIVENNNKQQDGLVFKVQILASKPKLPLHHKLLKAKKGVERYKHDGLYKYTWGEAKSLKEARQIKRELVAYGFEDAFIVPFYNGERIKMQEVIGQVFLKTKNSKHGLEGIKIDIYNGENILLTSLFSQNNGGFNFLGLKPGSYIAKLDTVQLNKLNLLAEDIFFSFQIDKNEEGYIKDPIKFILEKDSIKNTASNQHEIKSKSNLIFKVQIAASKTKLSPNHPVFRNKKGVEEYFHEGMYKYSYGKEKTLFEAKNVKLRLQSAGFIDAFIVAFLNGKRIDAKELEEFLKK